MQSKAVLGSLAVLKDHLYISAVFNNDNINQPNLAIKSLTSQYCTKFTSVDARCGKGVDAGYDVEC